MTSNASSKRPELPTIPTEIFDLLKYLLQNDPPHAANSINSYRAIASETFEALKLLTQFLMAYHTLGDDAVAHNKLNIYDQTLTQKLADGLVNFDEIHKPGQLLKLAQAIEDAGSKTA